MADSYAPRLKVLVNTTPSARSKLLTPGSHASSSPTSKNPTPLGLAKGYSPNVSKYPRTPRAAGPPSNRGKVPKRLSPVEEEYELHEYEWPDLPPLEQIREALSRGNISKGVRYLLPVDKTKNSVDGKFRTDLRKMFKRQYVNDLDSYDEEKVSHLTRFHFSTNTAPTDKRPKTIQVHPRDMPINHQSQLARQAYCQSAPAHGLVGSKTTPEDLKARSALNFPLKQKIPEEARRLKAEAERILKSVQEKEPEEEEDYDVHKSSYFHFRESEILTEQAMGRYRRSPDKRRQLRSRQRVTPSREFNRDFSRSRLFNRTKRQIETYSSYDDLKNAEVPKKREIPSRLKSRYLSGKKSERVWDWLNTGEKITDFSYFLEVCS